MPFSSAGISIGTLALFLVATIVVFLVVWLVPRRRVRSLGGAADPARAIELENELRKTAIQGVGGAALLLGLVFTWMQLSVAREDATQNRTERTEELALTRRSIVADRFARAMEQLADQRRTVQLGGIYTLQELGRESDEYRLTVASVLSSYIRAGLKRKPVELNNLADSSTEEERKVPLEALRIVSHLNPWQPPEKLPYVPIYDYGFVTRPITRSRLDLNGISLAYTDISHLDLRGAVLEGANLMEAELTGADLTGAMLAEADLSGARAKGIRLRGADLRGTSLENANLQDADLAYAILGGGVLATILDDAYLRGANISGLDLRSEALTAEALDGACGDEQTRLPEGVGDTELCAAR